MREDNKGILDFKTCARAVNNNFGQNCSSDKTVVHNEVFIIKRHFLELGIENVMFIRALFIGRFY